MVANAHKISVLLDSADYIPKCMRNNWINLKDNNRPFSILF